MMIYVPNTTFMTLKLCCNKHCDYANVYLNGNHIDFVQEVKYLGDLLNSSMKTSIDVSRQTRKNSIHKPICYSATFVIIVGKIKCMLFKSFCTNMYCCPLWFNSTSSSIKKIKSSYNSVLRHLQCCQLGSFRMREILFF